MPWRSGAGRAYCALSAARSRASPLVEAEQFEVVDGAGVDGLVQRGALEEALDGDLDALAGEGVRDAGDFDDLVGDVARARAGRGWSA